MTEIKVETSLAAAAEASIDHARNHIYANSGIRVVAVVELAHVTRNEPAAGEEKKKRSVTIGIKHLELARGPEQEEHLRQAMQALKVQRTAYGTIDEELGTLGLSESTLEDCANRLAFEEVARLRAALKHGVDTLRRLRNGNFTMKDIKVQIHKAEDIAKAALHGNEAAEND